MDNDEHVMDPQENPQSTGHLPVSGEVGNGPVSYHDPVTQPTDDEPADPVPLAGTTISPNTQGNNETTPINNVQGNSPPNPEQTSNEPAAESPGAINPA